MAGRVTWGEGVAGSFDKLVATAASRTAVSAAVLLLLGG